MFLSDLMFKRLMYSYNMFQARAVWFLLRLTTAVPVLHVIILLKLSYQKKCSYGNAKFKLKESK